MPYSFVRSIIGDAGGPKWAVFIDPADTNAAQFAGSVLAYWDGTKPIPIQDFDGLRLPIKVGYKGHNVAGPGLDNVGALIAVANQSPPILTDGRMCAVSVDLDGNLRIASLSEFATDTTLATGHRGTAILAVRRDENVVMASLTGRYGQVAMDQFGRLLTADAAPLQETPVTVNLTATSDAAILAAPGANVANYIQRGTVHNFGTSKVRVSLKDGATVRWRATLAADGGGSIFDFGSKAIRLTTNTAFNGALSAVGDVDVNVTQWHKGP